MTGFRHARLVRALLSAAVLAGCIALPLPLARPVQAMLPTGLALDPGQLAELRRLEAYLNQVTTMQGRFLQVSSNGGRATGTVFMSRPGRLRVEYTPPPDVLVVADGQFLIYHDRALDQVSYLPLSATPAGILLADRLSFDDPALTVTDFTDDGQSLRVRLVRTDNPGEGALTIVFSKKPMALSEWEVTDAQGITTQVVLADTQFGGRLDQELFQFRNPRLPGPGEFPTDRP
jgi:outer membrane lipoprotein-sorting protein